MKPFAGMTLVPSFISLAASQGVSLDKLYEHANIDITQVGRTKKLFSVEDVDRILQAYYTLKGPDSFFLKLGKNIRFDSLGAVGSMIASSSTPREAFEDLNTFKDIIHPYANLRLMDIGNNRSSMVYDPDENEVLANKVYYKEMIFSAVVSLSRLMLGSDPRILEMHFTHDTPSYRKEYTERFGNNIRFNAQRDEMIFESEWLDYEIMTASPEFKKLSSQKARSELARLPTEDNLVARVVRSIEEHIGKSVLSMQKVAEKLNITPRTLQRRLKDEGTTYATLRDKVLFKNARRYLMETDLDMATISANLSFSEPATFNNAFKRWSGMSPGAYRKKHRKNY